MIFLGKQFWTGEGTEQESFPIWQLLEKTTGDNYKDLLMLTDDLGKIVDAVKIFDPEHHMS